MNIVITGGARFLGVKLARQLLARGQLSLAGGAAQSVECITLVDRAAPPPDLLANSRIRAVAGDLNTLFRAKSPSPASRAGARRYHFSFGSSCQRRMRG